MHRNKKLRESANGAPCFMFGPACTGGGPERGDVCWRHSNEMRHGKSTGIKAHDLFGMYGCQSCENWFTNDLTREERVIAFEAAWHQSMIYAADLGVL